jgi:hypothetical protein
MGDFYGTELEMLLLVPKPQKQVRRTDVKCASCGWGCNTVGVSGFHSQLCKRCKKKKKMHISEAKVGAQW